MLLSLRVQICLLSSVEFLCFWCDVCFFVVDVAVSLRDTVATLTTLFHGVSFHLAHPTTAQVKDVISVSERNF